MIPSPVDPYISFPDIASSAARMGRSVVLYFAQFAERFTQPFYEWIAEESPVSYQLLRLIDVGYKVLGFPNFVFGKDSFLSLSFFDLLVSLVFSVIIFKLFKMILGLIPTS